MVYDASSAAEALQTYGLPEMPAEPELQALLRLAATVTGAATTTLNVLDETHQTQYLTEGFTGGRCAREDSMCDVTVRAGALISVADASRDPRFARSPWVDGRLASVRMYCSAPLITPGGLVLGTLCAFDTDVHTLTPRQEQGVADLAGQVVALLERRRLAVAAQLAATEARARQVFLDAILDSLDVAVVACDQDGHLILFNDAARQWHGMDADRSIDPSALPGRYQLFCPDGVTPMMAEEVPLALALERGSVQAAPIVVGQGDGARQVLAHGRAMIDGSGRPTGAVVAMHDVTALRRRESDLAAARDAAVAATDAKAAFLATVSHEIRNPLNGVVGMLDLLATDDLPPEAAGRADAARRWAANIVGLLNTVLDLSKDAAGHAVAELAPADPRLIVADVAALAVGLAVGRDVAVEVDASPTLPTAVITDRQRLQQVLVNVVSNAAKFTTSGRIRLTAEDVRDDERGLEALRFTVADTGPGMSVDEQESVFLAYRQGAAGRESGGTGLGLAITEQLLRLLDGFITVDSELGSGTTVTITVPVAAVDDATIARSGGEVAVSEAWSMRKGVRVLLADDDAVTRMVTGAILESLGAEVVTVEDGQAAVEAAAAGDFDIVLLDGDMPVLDGLAATWRITAQTARRPQVYAFTGRTDPADLAAFAAAGAAGRVVKPAGLDDLSQLLSRSGNIRRPRPSR